MEWWEELSVTSLRLGVPPRSLPRWSTVSAKIRMVADTVTTSSRCPLARSHPENRLRRPRGKIPKPCVTFKRLYRVLTSGFLTGMAAARSSHTTASSTSPNCTRLFARNCRFSFQPSGFSSSAFAKCTRASSLTNAMWNVTSIRFHAASIWNTGLG